jgi:hypothetical protein
MAKYNKSGRYKDILSGEMVNCVGVAVPVNPNDVLCRSVSGLQGLLKHELVAQLEQPPYQFPKKFDLHKFFS